MNLPIDVSSKKVHIRTYHNIQNSIIFFFVKPTRSRRKQEIKSGSFTNNGIRRNVMMRDADGISPHRSLTFLHTPAAYLTEKCVPTHLQCCVLSGTTIEGTP